MTDQPPSTRHLTKPAQEEPTREQIAAALTEMFDDLDSLNGQCLYEPSVQAVLEWAGIDHGRTPRQP